MLIHAALSASVIGACVEVHRVVGPGLLESAYHACLAQELVLRGLAFEHEKALPMHYKGIELEQGYRLDFVIEGTLVLEVKAVEQLLPIHEAQLITYLRLANLSVGLLINFHAPTLKAGLRRFTNTRPTPSDLRASAPPCSEK
jgi:GxxExxY protein